MAYGSKRSRNSCSEQQYGHVSGKVIATDENGKSEFYFLGAIDNGEYCEYGFTDKDSVNGLKVSMVCRRGFPDKAV